MDFKKDADQIRRCLIENNVGSGLELADAHRALHRAVDVLYKLDKLRRDLDALDPEDEAASDRLALEVVALLGLRRS